MEITLSKIKPIPVEYVLSIARTKGTDAKKRPYIELIERWGEEQGQDEEARLLLEQLREVPEIDVKRMPREFLPRYRKPEIAQQLVEIVREIDVIINSKSENWTWAHVRHVMIDEGIINKINKTPFDVIITSMIPGKGLGNVRHNGDFEYMDKHPDPWVMWPQQSHLDPEKAAHRIMFNQIAMKLRPVLERPILPEY